MTNSPLGLSVCRVHVLWARMKEHEPSAPYAQFVAAFTDGEVDAWPESYHERSKAAQQWFAEFADVEFFFTTVSDIERPTIPEPSYDFDPVFPCAICGWQETCAEGCHV